MADQIAQQYENSGIYIVLYARGIDPNDHGDEPLFHWGIYVPTATPDGRLYHATNRSGGWQFEARDSRVPTSQSLVLAFKAGCVTDETEFQSAIGAVPVDSYASSSTGQTCNCVTWAKDALLALHKAGIIVLLASIEEIESWAEDQAGRHLTNVETGLASALVFNNTGHTA